MGAHAANARRSAGNFIGLLVERLLRAMKLSIDENLTSEQKLARQGMMLDSLFTSMLLAAALIEGFTLFAVVVTLLAVNKIV